MSWIGIAQQETITAANKMENHRRGGIKKKRETQDRKIPKKPFIFFVSTLVVQAFFLCSDFLVLFEWI